MPASAVRSGPGHAPPRGPRRRRPRRRRRPSRGRPSPAARGVAPRTDGAHDAHVRIVPRRVACRLDPIVAGRAMRRWCAVIMTVVRPGRVRTRPPPTRTEDLHGEFPQDRPLIRRDGRAGGRRTPARSGPRGRSSWGSTRFGSSQGVLASFFPPQAITDRGAKIRELYDLVFGDRRRHLLRGRGTDRLDASSATDASRAMTSCRRRPTATRSPRSSGRSSRRSSSRSCS